MRQPGDTSATRCGRQAGGGRRGAHVVYQAADVLEELVQRQETLDVDRGEEDGVAEAGGLRLAAARARESAGEDVHHDREPVALVGGDAAKGEDGAARL